MGSRVVKTETRYVSADSLRDRCVDHFTPYGGYEQSYMHKAAAMVGRGDCFPHPDENLLNGDYYKVTIEKVEAKPGMKRWYCRWATDDTGFEASTSKADYRWVERMHISWSSDGSVAFASGYMESATEPTLAEFAAAVKGATGVEIPVLDEEEEREEQPQWWAKDILGDKWLSSPSSYPGVMSILGTPIIVRVYGTIKDRDEKADALVEAYQKASP